MAGNVSFDNTEIAFAYKTDAALKKARLLFGAMDIPLLVRLGSYLTPWAIRTGLPVKNIIRNTLFAQFVGGETLEQTAAVVEKLSQHQVAVILDYGVEGGNNGEDDFAASTDEFIRVINYASTQPTIPFISIKVTGFSRFGLLEKIDRSVADSSGSLMKRYRESVEALTEGEKAEWQRVEERMDRICRVAAEKGVGVLVDAEETWIQDPVDVLTILMMERYNRSAPVVYNTVQLYRHDRLRFLKDMMVAADQRGFIPAVKLVRGAYMEKERKRAEEMGYPSPIQSDKQATDSDYNAGVRWCIDRLDRVATIIASHNEESNMLALQLAQEKVGTLRHPHLHFSQLYGMSDNITFNLAAAGCSVSKYLPFGPVKEVVPYLMRRAQENSSIAGQTGRELSLIKKEMRRRGIRL